MTLFSPGGSAAPRAIYFSFALLAAQILAATPLTTLDNAPTQLADHLQTPTTLVLIVYEQEDIPHAQRLITHAIAEKQPALILINLPDSRLEAIAIRKAARTFFKSPFSRSHTYYIQNANNPYPKTKTLLLTPYSITPSYTSPIYPTNLPKGRSDLGREHQTQSSQSP